MHVRVKTLEFGGVEVISTFAREQSEKQPQHCHRVHPVLTRAPAPHSSTAA